MIFVQLLSVSFIERNAIFELIYSGESITHSKQMHLSVHFKINYLYYVSGWKIL